MAREVQVVKKNRMIDIIYFYTNNNYSLLHQLHRHPPHLIQTPILPHILRPQSLHLLIQMRPQNLPKPIHDPLQLPQIQLPLPTLHISHKTLQSINPRMDPLVLLQMPAVLLEHVHTPREHREDVAFFDGVVDGEVVGELENCGEELSDGHSLGAFIGGCGGVEGVPGAPEVFMLDIDILVEA